jgi:Tfp pilus assembly protein PilO
MTNGIDREILAHAVIVLALCVGAWFVLVEPRSHALAEYEQIIAQHESQQQRVGAGGITDLADHINKLRSDVERIAQRSSLGRDSSQLYARAMQLAKANNVTLTTLQPSAIVQTDDQHAIARTHVDIAIQGRYDDVASFITAISQLHGYIRPDGMTITSRSGVDEQIVSARFSCEAISFDLPDELVALGEFEHVDG